MSGAASIIAAADQTEKDSLAQFLFEAGYTACWSDVYMKAGGAVPFPISDAAIERAWEITPEVYDPAEEFAAKLLLANGAKDLLEALRPFAEACSHLHPSHPDDSETLDGFKAGDFRRAAAAYFKATGAPA